MIDNPDQFRPVLLKPEELTVVRCYVRSLGLLEQKASPSFIIKKEDEEEKEEEEKKKKKKKSMNLTKVAVNDNNNDKTDEIDNRSRSSFDD